MTNTTDTTGSGGKVPINPEYVVEMDEERVVMRNYQGEVYEYRQVGE